MNRNTALIIGILATFMVLFGTAVALARNTSENKTEIDTGNLEWTPEMMGNETAAVENINISGSHCEDMDSDMNSMMSSRDIGMKGM